jgi:hypothetical protein
MKASNANFAATPAWFRWVAPSLLLAGFVWFIGPGLFTRFTPDDIINLHAAWSQPWGNLLLQAACPWLPGIRPVGGVLYRASFEAFGFDLLAFRILLISLLAFNIWLTASICARIAGDSWTAWFAASLSLYHLNFQALYWNTGACYDILAFSGTWWAAWVALRARTDQIPAWLWGTAALAYWLALGAKEIALALPAILLAFELLPGRRQWAAFLFALVAAGGCLVGRIYSPGGIQTHALYVPQFTLAAYGRSSAVMLGDLVYQPGWFSPRLALGLVAALGAVAAVTRSRPMLLTWLSFVSSALPVALIPPRGVYAWYLPLAALWMLAGMLLARLPLPKPALWTAITAVLLMVHARAGDRIPRFILDEQDVIARVLQGLARSPLTPDPPVGFLIVSDPFAPYPWGEWKSAMLIQLHRRRPDLLIQYPHEQDLAPGLTPLVWRNHRFER